MSVYAWARRIINVVQERTAWGQMAYIITQQASARTSERTYIRHLYASRDGAAAPVDMQYLQISARRNGKGKEGKGVVVGWGMGMRTEDCTLERT